MSEPSPSRLSWSQARGWARWISLRTGKESTLAV